MTDLEMTTLCAEAIGLDFNTSSTMTDSDGEWLYFAGAGPGKYNPIHDDEQAMALVKKLRLYVMPFNKHWRVSDARIGKLETAYGSHPTNVNRAIVECVANIQTKQQSAAGEGSKESK